jgi:hypothetical protein
VATPRNALRLGPQVLDVDRFPEIRFQSPGVELKGPDHWIVHGNLGLHGKHQPKAHGDQRSYRHLDTDCDGKIVHWWLISNTDAIASTTPEAIRKHKNLPGSSFHEQSSNASAQLLSAHAPNINDRTPPILSVCIFTHYPPRRIEFRAQCMQASKHQQSSNGRYTLPELRCSILWHLS